MGPVSLQFLIGDCLLIITRVGFFKEECQMVTVHFYAFRLFGGFFILFYLKVISEAKPTFYNYYLPF